MIDHGYPIGAINLCGQTPIILMVDTLTLGGFINPYTVPTCAWWKLGQSRPTRPTASARSRWPKRKPSAAASPPSARPGGRIPSLKPGAGAARNATEVERTLWRALRSMRLPVKVRRQHPIGRYIADFAVPAHKLVIEIDGAMSARAPSIVEIG